MFFNRQDYSKDINKWLALCKLSEAERKEKQPAWDDIDDYFRGIQWKKNIKEGIDIVTVNLVYSHVKIVIPSTYLRYPKIYFIPTSPASVDATRLLETVLNADMRMMKLKDINKRIIQDVCLYGTGYSKTTFETEGDVEPDLAESQTADDIMARFKDTQAAAINGGGITPLKARPHCARISPRNIFFSVGATSLSDPGFIGHCERKRVASLKNNPYYKNTKDLKPNERIRGDLRSSLGAYSGYGAEEYLDYVWVYEIWDVDNQQWLTFAEDNPKFLTEPSDNPYPVEHPFDKVVFTPLEDQMWGFSEIEPALPQFDELNGIRTQQYNHLKRYNRKYLVREGVFSDEEDEVRLEAGEDGTIVHLRLQPGVPLNQGVDTLADAPMPADIYRVGVNTEDDIVKVTRVTPYRQGGIVGANTATEANLAESAAEAGDSDRVDAMAEFTLCQLEKVRKMRAALTIGQEMIDYTGDPSDVNRWQYWTKDDIDLEAQMMIEIGSTRAVSDESRKAEALQLYQAAIANPTVNPQSAFTKLLEAYGERDMPGWFLPQAIIQMQMMIKLLQSQKEGQQNSQPGISPSGGSQPSLGAGTAPGPPQARSTPAEAGGVALQNSGAA